MTFNMILTIEVIESLPHLEPHPFKTDRDEH